MNIAKSMKPRINSAMTVLLLQAHLVPPDWSASSRQTIAGSRVRVPGRSNCLSFPIQPNDASATFLASFKENNIIAIVTPPMGRFIQKHHLQVNLSVKTPPKSGPTTDAIPYIEPIILVYIGRFRSGTVEAMMIREPE